MNDLNTNANAIFEVVDSHTGPKTILIRTEEDDGDWFLVPSAIDHKGREYPVEGFPARAYPSREAAVAAIDGVIASRKYRSANRTK